MSKFNQLLYVLTAARFKKAMGAMITGSDTETGGSDNRLLLQLVLDFGANKE